MGVATVTMELMTFDIPRPGRYAMIIGGLDEPGTADPAHRVVFLRPHMEKTAGYIVDIVLLAAVFIASLPFAGLRAMRVGLEG